MYEVYLERTAENDLKRLPGSTFQRIILLIKTLAENPRPFFRRPPHCVPHFTCRHLKDPQENQAGEIL